MVRSVLIVDDEDIIIRLGKRVLEENGYCVYSGMSADAALNILEEKKDEIGLAILDVLLPDLEGNELAEMLFNIKPTLSILFSSGYGLTEEVQRAMADQKADFIAKPFTREDLLEKVEKLFSGGDGI